MKHRIPPKLDRISLGQYMMQYYDRISFTVPKGVKYCIDVYAEEHGESLPQFVQRAVMERMGVTEWPEPPQKYL